MIKDEDLDHAILRIVFHRPSEPTYQGSSGDWLRLVQRDVPEADFIDLKLAFTRLRNNRKVHLINDDGIPYSGNEADDERFFYTGRFTASATDEGRSYWNRLRHG